MKQKFHVFINHNHLFVAEGEGGQIAAIRVAKIEYRKKYRHRAIKSITCIEIITTGGNDEESKS
jgi:hypothetical protein